MRLVRTQDTTSVDPASWRGQDVLARARPTDLDDIEHHLPMPATHQEYQDHRWYGVLVRCIGSVMRYISPEQIKRHTRESQKYQYTLVPVPRTSTLAKRILEEEGVLGDVTISPYNLQFIPLAEDVISLENDTAFKEIWVVRPPVVYRQVRHARLDIVWAGWGRDSPLRCRTRVRHFPEDLRDISTDSREGRLRCREFLPLFETAVTDVFTPLEARKTFDSKHPCGHQSDSRYPAHAITEA